MKRRLLRRLRQSSPNLFITLTTSTRTAPTPEEAFHRASHAFADLIRIWRRRFPGQPVEYFLVWERTKAGWPHAHVLLKAPLVSKHWLSTIWRQQSGSYIVDLQPVSSLAHAAGYLAKYLAKDPQTPPGCRRWRRSAAFFVVDKDNRPRILPAGTTWHREPWSLDVQRWRWLKAGLQPLTELNGLTRAIPDPGAAAAVRASPYFDRLTAYVRLRAPELFS